MFVSRPSTVLVNTRIAGNSTVSGENIASEPFGILKKSPEGVRWLQFGNHWNSLWVDTTFWALYNVKKAKFFRVHAVKSYSEIELYLPSFLNVDGGCVR